MLKRGRYTADEVELLEREYANAPTAALAARMGRLLDSVYRKASALRLRKSETYLASAAACRLRRGDAVGAAHRFRPGVVPWNKGVHYVPGGRSAQTRFAKGNKPQTWVPIGSWRVTKDGYPQIKRTDTGYSPRDWVSYHQHVWEQAHGPKPAGHVVVFRPGAKTREVDQITIDKLECISRAELMARNSVHVKYPPAVARLVQLRGVLTRQINRKAKEAE